MSKHTAKNAPIRRRPLSPSILTLTLTGNSAMPVSPCGPFELVSELGYAGYRLMSEPVVTQGDTYEYTGLTLRVVAPRRTHEDHIAALSEFMDEMGVPSMLIEVSAHAPVLLQVEEEDTK